EHRRTRAEPDQLQRRGRRRHDQLHQHAHLHGGRAIEAPLPRIRTLALLWTVATMAAVHSAHAGILAQVAPVRYSVTATPGEPATRDVLITNQGTDPVVVTVHLSDWTLSEAGQMNLVPAGSTPNSLAGKVDYEPAEFSLGAGESGHIKVRL